MHYQKSEIETPNESNIEKEKVYKMGTNQEENF